MHLPGWRNRLQSRVCWPVRAVGLVVLITGCEELPRIPAGVCGNHVVEGAEECDFPGERCHAPGRPNECRINCSKQPCEPGAGCGVDDVCRVASGSLDWKRLREFSLSYPVKAADLSGDGRTDVLFGSSDRMTGATLDGDQPRVLGELPISYYSLRTGELNGDGRADVIGFNSFDEGDSNAVRVLHSSAEGALTSVSQLEPGPEGQDRRLFVADSNGSGESRPLLLAGSSVFQVPERSFAEWREYRLADLALSGPALVERLAAADFDSETGCDEVAVAEEGSSEVHVYSLCASNPARSFIAAVHLPEPVTVARRGLFAGDVNGDGHQDLLIEGDTLDEWEGEVSATPGIYVSYGRGDGTFDSQPEPSPGPGDSGSSQLELPSGEYVLAVADLDGDERVDIVDDYAISLSTLSDACVDFYDCAREHSGGWASAVTGDFNGDDLMDVIGVRWGEKGLAFMRGFRTAEGATKFNEFSIPTEGLPLTSSIDQMDVARAVLAVGDFDGDLVSDLVFSQRRAVLEAKPELTVLFGAGAPAVPSEMRHIDSVDDLRGLAVGRLFEREDTLSDLVMLARRGSVEGLARLAGQTNRELFSPLGIPERADRNSELYLVDAALGRFRADDDGKPLPSDDLVMVATRINEQTGTARTKLYFVANTPDGFASGDVDAEPYELRGTFEVYELGMSVLDLDGNGVQELVVYPRRITNGRFAYWLVQRIDDKFAVTAHVAEVVGGAPLMAANHGLVDPDRTPRDIDGDGRTDLSLGMQEFSELEEEEGRAYEVVLLAGPDMTLGSGHAFEVPTLVSDAAYLNLDGDVQLELAVVDEQSLDLYELPFSDGKLVDAPLRMHSTYPMVEDYPIQVEVGDFDGNGVEDLVTSGLATGVCFGQARRP
jgi:hypothetical protein